jgi:RNA polymerase sigma-70 factor (ECF subfamily)
VDTGFTHVAEGEDLAVESDEDLARRAQAGETAAFDDLVGRFAKPMLNFFVRSLGKVDQAEDLWQQTFVTAFERLGTFDAARPFKPWLYGIAVNHLRNAWRAQATLPRHLPDDMANRWSGRERDPKDVAADREAAQVIWEGVRALSEEQRAVFVLRIYHGLSYAEIAEILDCPVGTAKSRMHFAAEAVRKGLRERGIG